MEVLSLFHKDTARWFADQVGKPTAVQREAWPAISNGGHVLVSAPTGTGKTLAAFLVLIDRLKALARQGKLSDALEVIYVSPLKALGNDIRENLRRPLEGIGGPELRVDIRTGDTPQSQRQKMLRRPPHILITTPESLYLLLTTARGRTMLSTAKTVILDELHVMLSGKRGAHLMLSLARLDALCEKPLQRIGLSATIRPLALAAAYLAAGEPVTTVAPVMHKDATIEVNSPLDDMRVLPEGTIWPELCRMVYDHCRGKRTVIAFLEGRAAAEKLARGVNELAGEGFALTHHGSVSKEQRLEAERALRSGRLRLLCATSSMELGIDVGDVDLVLQIGNPITVSAALQRMGRAGHNPGRTSVMHIFPRMASEGVACGLTATVALEGGIEPAHPPMQCLDVLAQHLVSMAVDGGYRVDDVMRLLARAYPFSGVTKEQVERLLCMLAGDYEHEEDQPARPRLIYDRLQGTVQGDAYSRMLALSAGGTIPDRGMYPVYLADGTRLGELDEEFVFEARIGDKFLLGAFAWRIAEIRKDRVMVQAATPEGAQPPFWKGDGTGRSYATSLRLGQLMKTLADKRALGHLEEGLREMHMDEAAAVNAQRHLERQMEVTGCWPDHRTVIAEHFTDEAGEHQLMIHSIFGRRVNYGLSLLVQHAAARSTGVDVRAFEDDDGILLYTIGSKPLPDRLLLEPDPQQAEGYLRAMLPATPLFSMVFRYNAARALMMGVRSGRRQPLWVQRIRGAQTLSAVAGRWDHPLMEESLRECMEDYLDIPALREVLIGLRSGKISLRELHLESPSPMALPLRRQAEAVLLYDYHPIPSSANQASMEALAAQEALAPSTQALEMQQQRSRSPRNSQELHNIMMAEGDFIAGELPAPLEWVEELARKGRACYIEPGLWICAEQQELYRQALEESQPDACLRIARRCLRYRGPQDGESLRQRYLWPLEQCESLLHQLIRENRIVEQDGLYYHGEIYSRAQRQTVMDRRRQARTLSPGHYGALLTRRLRKPGGPIEQLADGLIQLEGMAFPIKTWEELLLPARVDGYRPALLDEVLAQGQFFWHITPGEKPLLSFYRAQWTDWDSPPQQPEGELTPDEKLVLRALEQRGASFSQTLAAVLEGRSVVEVLLSLALKGLVRADSFAPLRHWMTLEGKDRLRAKESARVRTMARQAGRWERCRPVRTQSEEEGLTADFTRWGILCRETVSQLSWSRALELLRVWEYTGRARRGYFVAGLSGAQFIAEEQYAAVTSALELPDEEPVWLAAADPMQPWGRILPHQPDRAFLCVPGTAVCLAQGEPIAVLERQGEKLRVFDQEKASAALAALSRDFLTKHIFPGLNRLVIRRAPETLGEALKSAGFVSDMLDYTLWRGR